MEDRNTFKSRGNVLTYYDLLSYLCFNVHNLETDFKQKLYKHASHDFPKYVRRSKSMCPWLHINNATSQPLYTNFDISSSLLISQLMRGTDLDNWSTLLGVISSIDSMMSLNPNFKVFLNGRQCKIIEDVPGSRSSCFYSFDALNCSTKNEYGLLLPNVFCEWKKQSDRTIESVSMNPLSISLNNYIWVSNDPKWQITNLYCDFRNTMFNRVMLSNLPRFSIVSSPLCRQAPFNTSLNDEKGEFYITYVPQSEDSLIDRHRKIIDYAIEHRTDIVVFPEMMGTRKTIDACREYISNRFCEWKPKLFLLPTWEHQEDGYWNNTLYVLDENGDCIHIYNKQHPFSFDKETDKDGGKITYNEPIQRDGNIFVIHVPGIGRIGVIICADIFEEGYLVKLAKDLKITLLLFPVFTFGKDLMERALAPMLQYSCDVLFCNTCAAWDEILTPINARNDNNDFDSNFINIYYSFGHRTNEDNAAKHVGRAVCKNTRCQGCLFVAEIPKLYQEVMYTFQQIRLEDI